MDNKKLTFATEAEEAVWWENNQELIAELFVQAKTSGNLGSGIMARTARERAGQAVHLQVGDYLEAGVEGGKITFTPKTVPGQKP